MNHAGIRNEDVGKRERGGAEGAGAKSSGQLGRVPELDGEKGLRLLRAAAWSIAILAGFLQVWAQRFSTTPDGTCYLDVAAAYLRADWHNAVNAYWSPLFSWLLALGLWIFRPGPYWESTLLHLVNFAGLLIALVCFEFLFRSFLRRSEQITSTGENSQVLSKNTWWLLGYGLFLSTTLFLLPASDTSPDIWVAAFTYVVAGLIMRIRTAGGSWRLFALLGFTLALAYFTKTFYFPTAFVWLAAAWEAAGNLRHTAKLAALGFLVFFIAAGPWIFVLSRAKQRVTFGDVGKLAIDIGIDQIPQSFFWQGENGSGVPRHAVRQLLAHPRIFEFATPIAGTYPPAFDESYWMEGVRLRLNLRGPLAVLRQSFGTFFLIWQLQVEYAVVLIVLFFAAANRREWWEVFREEAYLWLPPLVACALYVVVLVEFRYVAPFILLLWLAGISSFVHASSGLRRRFLFALFLAAFCVTGIKVAKFAVSDLLSIRANHENVDWEVAQGLWKLGLKPGDSVAGLSRVAESQWARAAGLKIVAEVPLGDDSIFWMAGQERKDEVFRIFAGTGAKVVVTKNPPPNARNESWVELGDTPFYVHSLPSPTSSGITSGSGGRRRVRMSRR